MTTTRMVFVQHTASKQIAYWHTDQKTAQLSGFLFSNAVFKINALNAAYAIANSHCH